ncbi:hypothetical protein ONZ45_g2167 [Pleurotus djamor]|nr:hypothetical protein ONZ45_g16791 [Pleurotus djamor]KAJ8521118.1 hypothetical protein ONZ45_g2167 [Pleurotus djamor]
MMPTAVSVPLKAWKFAAPTKAIPEDQYIDLEVIDLSVLDFPDEASHLQFNSLSESLKDLVSKAITAFKTTGFITVKGHGLMQNELQRQFDIGKFLVDDVSEEEKRALLANMPEGDWAGYKHYDTYPETVTRSRLPKAGIPLIPDIRRFIEHNHYVVLRKVLAIVSLGLGLNSDALWKMHHRGKIDKGSLIHASSDHVEWNHTKDHLRYVMYHPPTEEDRMKKRNLWFPGHTDSGTITLLYSQPIAGLQILTHSGEWRYARHYPGQILVNIGDTMEFITGGVIKATPHRVMEPPEDQRHLDRLGIFYFVTLLQDIVLKPIDHPSLVAMGSKDFFEEYYALGGEPFTAEGWRSEKAKLVGTKRKQREKREAVDVLEDVTYRYIF